MTDVFVALTGRNVDKLCILSRYWKSLEEIIVTYGAFSGTGRAHNAEDGAVSINLSQNKNIESSSHDDLVLFGNIARFWSARRPHNRALICH
jgi:hypothetical protein